MDRRKFIQTSAMASGAAFLPNTSNQIMKDNEVPFKNKLNIGFIGVGLRGQSHINLALKRTDCHVAAICDIEERMINRTLQIIKDNDGSKPKVINDGERGYLKMLEDDTIDAVIISTPWRWHTEMAVAAMKAGKYTGVEVAGAFSVEECWELVNTHEETGTHLFFLENVCYRRDVMAILNMVRENMFGELIHLECGYQHDLRGVKFNDGETAYNSGVEFGEKAYSEARWRTWHSVYRNGDLYPTHGIGPVAQYINNNRGNRLLYLTSIASKSRGLHNYVVDHPKGGEDHPSAKVKFNLGDKVTTMIKTFNEETIVIHHDTNLPRPYSLGFRVQGTRGLWMDVNNSLHIEGLSATHRWEDAQAYLQQYDHPLWKKYEDKAVGAGHGGMDFFLLNDFVESAKANKPAPFDAYDAATWMAITPLSEQSIAAGSQPMAFPDFTRGRWMHRKPIFAL